ncbi:hypothetical protein ACFV5G_12380 [Streptomyces sp. NPDC059766]|uniref:hypothetical protein n=1 Tax=Streptomyces sp. NPDC059766 TaxID=3346940 RepID=UPI003652430D
MVPTGSTMVSAITPAAWTTWSRAVWRAMLKLARSGSMSGRVAVASVAAILISW